MVSKIILIITTALLMSTAYAIPNSLMYVGFESTEALLEFNGTVQLDAETIPTEKVLREIIESQLEHIVGPMSLSSITAVPKGDHVVTNIKIISRKKLTLTVSYHYNGTLLIQNGPQNTFPIFLPVSPDKIYASSMVGETNPCTDDHYQSEGDFWYFWSPKRAGCKLIEGKDYIIINASIHRYKNTKISYPEYQNLPDQNGNITIHVLFGMDDTTQDRNPLLSNDINAENYRSFRNYLVKNGYKVTTWSDEQISSIAKTLDGAPPFVETVKKGKLEYRFFFAPTGINEEALGFHWFYKDALENASIVMYEGHSGLG